MASWESKYTNLSSINGGNKYTTDSQLTIDMFIVPIENAEYAVQKSINAETNANTALTKVNSYKITFNGSATTQPSFYAPTSAGTSGQVLKSSGGTPTWINQSDLSVGSANYATSAGSANSATNATNATNAKNATNDADGNKISDTYAKKSSLSTVATSGSYNDLDNKPTIPSSLSSLTNDINNMRMESTSWTRVPNDKLPSTGLYILYVSNAFGGPTFDDHNIGMVYYDGGSAKVLLNFNEYEESYRVKLGPSGKLELEHYYGNEYWGEKATFFYIKLS